ncbi:hypothetical protein SAMN02745220_00065 [Desulfopila aestuarii DSM 18488]|uniref:Uncharacterized protein n=1 Tax=Desulfopila aestuarii DSM 18488 TaxID=1121416 RepID=A0A1M7XVK2_9BACT|nr:hypothetical protein SAMN02745220_00065 [Desulfopila aestuarii DSM 18488]
MGNASTRVAAGGQSLIESLRVSQQEEAAFPFRLISFFLLSGEFSTFRFIIFSAVAHGYRNDR